MGCLPALGMLVIGISSLFLSFRLAEYVYINAAYGREAWQGGLRVVNKQGGLSNGQSLTRKGELIVFGGNFLLTAFCFLGGGFAMTYLSMRMRGERLEEQLAKWDEENAGGP